MIEAINASKSLLRKEIAQRISSLSAEYKKQQSEIVLRKLFSLPLFKESKRISVYLNTKDEVYTEPIIEKIFQTKKLCFVPRYDKQIMQMVKLHSINDYETLSLTKWNIKQPSLSEQRENALETGGLDLILIPGVAFSETGARLGHGKGYYDNFLTQCIEKQDMPPRTVALAFREQMVDDVPVTDHDILIDLVLHPETTVESDEDAETRS